MTRVARAAALCSLFGCAVANTAAAQNLFEVQVFPDETLGRGETELELHNVVMPSGTRLPGDILDPSAHVHLSVEVSHGWTNAFETGIFVETSPSSEDRHPAFTGFHFRPKFRLAEWPPLPFHGSIRRLEPLAEQHHLILPVVDIRSRSGWELNLGVGRGLTGASEHWIVKSILGVPLTRH